ncbi:MAG: NAD(P)/FAD-dependent oxidoreductase [Gammaproteobacteria bacterium]|nr:NAD(P)/FAD-dependent oxidoreductase [Gammaproteobacteria bacterium]
MSRHEVRVAILGAGMSGVCMAIQLKKRGYDSFVLLEKAGKVGGTWRENTYPGVACDVPSHLYSFSFALNPQWTRMYSPGSEIQQYIEDLVSRYDLGSHIKCNSTVVRASYVGNAWHVDLEDGTRYVTQVVVSALGGLHIPSIPNFAGMSDFGGEFIHTAQWPSALDVKGKRVAVIGTGASGVQIAPAIADQVAQLTVFQRTPAWVVPRGDFAFSNKAQEKFSTWPGLCRFYRWFIFWLLEIRGGFIKRDSRRNQWLESTAREFLLKSVADDELRQKLTPSFPIGCKRVLVSDDYYATLMRPNVDVETRPIGRIYEKGIQVEGGAMREFDVIVAATGFQPFVVNRSIDISGRNGCNLNEVWQERISAHRTVMVPGFPNLFFLLGPNSGLGHNSVLFMIESQARFIIRVLRTLRRAGLSTVEPRAEANEAFNCQLATDLENTVYGGGCGAWHTDSNDHNFTLWPHSTIRYYLTMRGFDPNEFLWQRSGASSG